MANISDLIQIIKSKMKKGRRCWWCYNQDLEQWNHYNKMTKDRSSFLFGADLGSAPRIDDYDNFSSDCVPEAGHDPE